MSERGRLANAILRQLTTDDKPGPYSQDFNRLYIFLNSKFGGGGGLERTMLLID